MGLSDSRPGCLRLCLPFRLGSSRLFPAPPGLPGSSADLSPGAISSHPGRSDGCSYPLLHRRWQASPLSGGLATSTLCNEAESSSRMLWLTGSPRKASPVELLPSRACLATRRTGNLQGELLSVHKISQAYPGAPEAQRRMADVGKTKGIFMPSSFSSLSLCASAVDSSRQSIGSTTVVRQIAQSKKPRHAEFKGLTKHVPAECRTTFAGSVGQTKREGVNLLIRRCLMANLLMAAVRRLAQSKGLANPSSVERRGDLFGFCRTAETWRGRSVDSARVVGRSTEENG